MALTKVTGQVIKNTTDVTVGVLTVTNTLAVGGTVSIGGTLTYEDVTNVDAVGLITARNGIVVGSGITLSKDGDIFATGIVTATSFVGSGANLTGVASTENIRTNTNATFLQNINVSGSTTTGSLVSSGAVSGTTGTFTGDVDIADKIVHTGDTNTAIRFPAADTITVETGGSERTRVDSSGNVNFGAEKAVALPSGTGIQVYNSSTPRIKLVNDTTGNASGDGSYLYVSGSDFLIENKESANMRFYTSATERLRITSAGEVQIANGNLKFSTAGKGIDFSATNDPAGQTSELLDDYEEGTWTPTIGGNATYTGTPSGTYVKVGRMVYAHWALTINVQGTGSAISAISGLPYPSGMASQVTSNLLWGGFGVSMAYAVYYVGNASTTMNLSYTAGAQTALTNNPNGLVNGATIHGTIVYYSSY